MFLAIFLVEILHSRSTHLLSGWPKPVRISLVLDLARNRCLDSESQDIIDNSLWEDICSLNDNKSQWFEPSSNLFVNNLPCQLHIHYIKQLQKYRAHNRTLISTHSFYPTTGPLVSIQLSFTLTTFHVSFIGSPSLFPPHIYLVFFSTFTTELELQVYDNFSLCSLLARSQVKTQQFYYFTVWIVSFFSPISST